MIARVEGYAVETRNEQIVEDRTTTVTIPLRNTKVELKADRIDIKGKVYFDTAKATIKSDSFDLLNEVAQVLKDHPEILKLRIEGHTDSRGSASYNLQLSTDRAASVRQYLIDQGVGGDRLVSEGFGETQPIDPRENATAWEQNRRVVFFVEEWDDTVAP